MLSFLTQRLLQVIPTLILVSMLIFGLQQLLPGDPALIMAGEERDPKVLAEIREQYKLDQPIPIQYLYHRRVLMALSDKIDGYKQMPDGLIRVVGVKLK